MRILFNIGHPGQVHLFKNLIKKLEHQGHHCLVTTISKDVSLYLLDAYEFDYVVVGKERPTIATKALELLRIETNLYRIARSFRPDLLIGGVGNVYVAHIGILLQKPSLVFDDTEHAKLEHRLMDRFVSTICTPSCYRDDIGKKQIRYNGYHELAYLHPDYFTPNPSVLTELGLNEGDPFIIVRFVSWQANHDVGHHGIYDKVRLVKELEQYGRIIITSEGPLPGELEEYRMLISPEKLHDLLYYAKLYIGEGATTASECAVLGTHAIYVNSLKLGYILEQERKYHLVSDFSNRNCDDRFVLEEAKRLLQIPELWEKGKEKRSLLIDDKIDVTAFMIKFIEQYSSRKTN